jgi:hypothetical protein
MASGAEFRTVYSEIGFWRGFPKRTFGNPRLAGISPLFSIEKLQRIVKALSQQLNHK